MNGKAQRKVIGNDETKKVEREENEKSSLVLILVD
jgi:hypothetical protein